MGTEGLTIFYSAQDPVSGVPLRAVKSFLSRIPDVFTGEDLVQWLMKFYGVDTNDEAVHLGNHNSVLDIF